MGIFSICNCKAEIERENSSSLQGGIFDSQQANLQAGEGEKRHRTNFHLFLEKRIVEIHLRHRSPSTSWIPNTSQQARTDEERNMRPESLRKSERKPEWSKSAGQVLIAEEAMTREIQDKLRQYQRWSESFEWTDVAERYVVRVLADVQIFGGNSV